MASTGAVRWRDSRAVEEGVDKNQCKAWVFMHGRRRRCKSWAQQGREYCITHSSLNKPQEEPLAA